MQVTAEARIIAAFTFVTALLLGVWQALHQLLSQLLGGAVEHDGDIATAVAGLLAAAVPAAIAVIASTAARATEERWARQLGGATVLLGALATAAGLLRTAIVYF